MSMPFAVIMQSTLIVQSTLIMRSGPAVEGCLP
jgi:hypothetical protein